MFSFQPTYLYSQMTKRYPWITDPFFKQVFLYVHKQVVKRHIRWHHDWSNRISDYVVANILPNKHAFSFSSMRRYTCSEILSNWNTLSMSTGFSMVCTCNRLSFPCLVDYCVCLNPWTLPRNFAHLMTEQAINSVMREWHAKWNLCSDCDLESLHASVCNDL